MSLRTQHGLIKNPYSQALVSACTWVKYVCSTLEKYAITGADTAQDQGCAVLGIIHITTLTQRIAGCKHAVASLTVLEYNAADFGNVWKCTWR